MEEEKFMWVKLLIDKEKNRVIFAESEQDFIDVLFSFFTLPIGTIIKLTNKNSNFGCMDALYNSVETLDPKYFQTHACKEMLLNPKSASEFITQNLVVNLDGVDDPKVYYLCPNWNCSTEGNCLASVFRNGKCCCGMEMTQKTDFVDDLVKGEVFVKRFDKFMVTDDLCVMTISTESSMGVVDMLRTKEGVVVDEMIVAVGLNEVVELLKCSLVSTKPMSDVFLLNQKPQIPVAQFHPPRITIPSSSVHQNRRIQVKLWIRKSTNKVLFAEVKEDFLDLLFSFLAFPLGYVVKFLGGYTPLGSMHNLYKSVEDLSTEHPHNFTEDKDHILDPQIAHHFGWQNQLINIEEASWETEHLKCITCFNMKVNECSHGAGHSTLHLVNPKFPNTVIKQGGGFMSNSVVFIVTDELVIQPFSWMESISIAKKLSVPCNDIEVRITDVGGEEALQILKTSVSSKEVLTDALCNMN